MIKLFCFVILVFFAGITEAHSSKIPWLSDIDLLLSNSTRPRLSHSWMFNIDPSLSSSTRPQLDHSWTFNIDPSLSSSTRPQLDHSWIFNIDPSLHSNSVFRNILSPYFEGTANLNGHRPQFDRHPYGAQRITENDQRAIGYFTYRARLREILRCLSSSSSSSYGYAGRNLATFFVELSNYRNSTDRDFTINSLALNAIDREYLGAGRFAFTYASTGGTNHSERNGWNDLYTYFEGLQNNHNFIYFIYTEREPCSGGGPNCNNLINNAIKKYRNPNDRNRPFVYFTEEYPNWNEDAEELIRDTNVPEFDLDNAQEFIQWYRNMGTDRVKNKDNEMIQLLSDAIQKEKKRREKDKDEL